LILTRLSQVRKYVWAVEKFKKEKERKREREKERKREREKERKREREKERKRELLFLHWFTMVKFTNRLETRLKARLGYIQCKVKFKIM
jgi:hypothetical protein